MFVRFTAFQPFDHSPFCLLDSQPFSLLIILHFVCHVQVSVVIRGKEEFETYIKHILKASNRNYNDLGGMALIGHQYGPNLRETARFFWKMETKKQLIHNIRKKQLKFRTQNNEERGFGNSDAHRTDLEKEGQKTTGA